MIKNLVAAMLAVGVISNVLKSSTVTFNPSVADSSIVDEGIGSSISLTDMMDATIQTTHTTVFNSVLVVYDDTA